jgi:hypothetical protein
MGPVRRPKPECGSSGTAGYIDAGTLCRSQTPLPGIVGLNTTLPPEELKRILVPLLGTCDFYKVLSALTPGDRDGGYYWNYGYKYCTRFKNSSLVKDPKAARWVDCVTINLQRQILSKCIYHGSNLAKVKDCAYATHAQVYTDCGICELDKSLISQFRVLFVPDPKDLWTQAGLDQVKETLRDCFLRPWVFSVIVDHYTSWHDLKEGELAGALVKAALADSANNYKVILGVMEMLSNTLDDDDVAEMFVQKLNDEDLLKLSKTGDGRRILFLMKSAMEGGYTWDSEKTQIKRIGNLSRR